MTAADELSKALLHAEAWSTATRSLAFRRIAELLIEAGESAGLQLRIRALASLERLRPQASPEARRDIARLAAERWADRTMLWLLRHEPPETLADLLARVRLTEDEWRALAPDLPAALRSLARRCVLAPAAPASHPAVQDGARQLDELRGRLRTVDIPRPEMQLAALAGDWRWECDTRGRLAFVEGTGAPMGVGDSLLDIDAAQALWTAFARQAPFRDVEVMIGDAGWRLAGVPFFERGTGGFRGYRGTAARVKHAGLFGTAASADTLAKLAHEVRSPLNAIMGFAQMIESETLGTTSEVYRRRAGVILENANRLLGALDDLTDAARLDRGHWPVEPEAIDGAALIERVAERYRPVGAVRGVGIAVTAPPGLPPLLADERSLDRALKRLLAAMIAVAEDRETLLLGIQRAGERVRLFLTRPAGIEELTPEHLYETASAAREGALAPLLGLGFGLRLVRQLTEAMGGEFAIDPYRFSLSFPAVVDQQSVAKRDQSA